MVKNKLRDKDDKVSKLDRDRTESFRKRRVCGLLLLA